MAIYTSIAFDDGIYEYEYTSAGILVNDSSDEGNFILEKKVLINGNENDNSFMLVISDDWIVCRRERNKLYITIKRNYSESERVGYLNVTSTQDNRASITLEIKQEGDVFSIETSEATLSLTPKPVNTSDDTDEPPSEFFDVGVTVTGGTGRFGIKRIEKHLTNNELADYDYGLKVEKNDDSINVINYGKVPIEENFDHYEIILYHLDKPEITATITVTYASTTPSISWECDTDVELPVTSGIEIISVVAKKNGEIADWSIVSVVDDEQTDSSDDDTAVDWVRCTAASNALILEYGEAEIGGEYAALVTLECCGEEMDILIKRNTDVSIVTPRPVPPHERPSSYPTGIIVLDETSENVYVETPVEETVSLIVPWDVEEFDVPLLTRFYEDEYTPFPTYDSNILITNKSRWMNTSLYSKYGEVYPEPIEGEEQVSYGELQIKVLTVTIKNNYSDMDRTYAIRLRDAQMPSNTIFLRITQTALDINSSDDTSDD